MRSLICSTLLALSLLPASFLPALAETAGSQSNSESRAANGHLAIAENGRRPKIGLALGGGGARGAAHVGVLKVLEEEGIPVDFVVGTSIGSVVGGLYAAGVPLSKVEESFTNSHLMKSFMTVPLWVRIVAAPVMVMPRLWSHPYDGLYKGNKFRNFLTAEVPSAERNIEDLKIPYSAVATSLVDGRPHRISKGSLGYAMQASCAVPGLRKPVQIGNDLFCDGYVSANVPVKQCKEMGADIVIAVCIDEQLLPEPLDNFRKIGSVSRRLIKMQLRDIAEPALAQANVAIHPNVDGISLISTKKSDAQRGIKAGEAAAKAAIPSIKQKLAEAGIGIAGSAQTN
ncbi:MAG: patatin-like phospholipase family protein [Candidatus Obscuribacterales bacterium]|nr:patatin-like phospholipase family protein [Candidatus Obscuribacterales bacterium]